MKLPNLKQTDWQLVVIVTSIVLLIAIMIIDNYVQDKPIKVHVPLPFDNVDVTFNYRDLDDTVFVKVQEREYKIYVSDDSLRVEIEIPVSKNPNE